MKKIEKRLQIQLTRGKELSKTFEMEIDFCEGDIVSDGSNMYYVINRDSTHTYCYVFSEKYLEDFEKFSLVNISKNIYYIYFDEQIVFSDTSKLRLLDIASVQEVLAIRALKKEYFLRRKDVGKQEKRKGIIFHSEKGACKLRN